MVGRLDVVDELDDAEGRPLGRSHDRARHLQLGEQGAEVEAFAAAHLGDGSPAAAAVVEAEPLEVPGQRG